MGKAAIDVEVQTGSVRLSRETLAPFWSAFVHVIRNAVDHGIETGEERLAHGKPGRARLRLTAARVGDDVVLNVADDGRGIDWEKVGARAKAAGLRCADRLDLQEALFRDGLSTKEDVAEVSGRGVGLAAVRAECDRLSGTIRVTSERAEGTTFQFTFPAKNVALADPRFGALMQRAAGLASNATYTRISTPREPLDAMKPE